MKVLIFKIALSIHFPLIETEEFIELCSVLFTNENFKIELRES